MIYSMVTTNSRQRSLEPSVGWAGMFMPALVNVSPWKGHHAHPIPAKQHDRIRGVFRRNQLPSQTWQVEGNRIDSSSFFGMYSGWMTGISVQRLNTCQCDLSRPLPRSRSESNQLRASIELVGGIVRIEILILQTYVHFEVQVVVLFQNIKRSVGGLWPVVGDVANWQIQFVINEN